MHINCPHCQNPIEIVADQPAEIVCPSCGSSIMLDPGKTRTFLPTGAARHVAKFTLLEHLGAGAFGNVYKARDTELDRIVALKIPRTGNLTTKEDVDRFLREARSAAQLKHPGIVSLYDAGQSDSTYYLVSEFIQGTTLSDRLGAGRVSFRQAAELVASVADALHFAHERGVIHRDIKPSNIMIDLDGRPHVMDFGLAKRDAGEITMTLDGQVLGTPAYMPPEQARGEGHSVDARGDVYSLGVILYELVTGELPFRGSSRMLIVQVIQDEPRPPRRINDKIPRDLETITLKCMAKEPARRYASAGDSAADLRRWLEGKPIHARPVGNVERLWRWAKRNPRVAGLTGAVTVLLVTLAIGSTASAFRIAVARKAAEDSAEAAQLHAREEQAARADAQRAESDARKNLAASDDRLAQYYTLRGLEAAASGDHAAAMILWAEAVAKREQSLALGGAEDLGNRMRLAVYSLHLAQPAAVLDHSGPFADVAFAPSGQALAAIVLETGSGTPQGKVAQVWDISARNNAGLLLEHGDRIERLSFSPDGRWLVTNTLASCTLASWAGDLDDSLFYVWDVATGKQIRLLEALPNGLAKPWEQLRHTGFSEDGKWLLTTTDQRELILWKKDPLQPVAVRPVGVSGSARFSSGGHLVDASTDWKVFRFDPQEVKCNNDFGDEKGRVTGLERPKELRRRSLKQTIFTLKGNRCLALCDDGMTRVWEVDSGKPVCKPWQLEQIVTRVSLSWDGTLMMVTSEKATRKGNEESTRIRDIGRGEYVTSAFARDPLISHASPDGRWLLAPLSTERTLLWLAASGQPRGPALVHQGPVVKAVFSPDGRSVLTASWDNTARLWDLRTGEPKVPPLGRARAGVRRFEMDSRAGQFGKPFPRKRRCPQHCQLVRGASPEPVRGCIPAGAALGRGRVPPET